MIKPLQHRDSLGNRTVATIKLERTQQRYAVAAEMTLEAVNVRNCKNCQSRYLPSP